MIDLDLHGKRNLSEYSGEQSYTDCMKMIYTGYWPSHHPMKLRWKNLKKELNNPHVYYLFIVEAKWLEQRLLKELDNGRFYYDSNQSWKIKRCQKIDNNANQNILVENFSFIKELSNLSEDCKNIYESKAVYDTEIDSNLKYGVHYFALTQDVYSYLTSNQIYKLKTKIIRYPYRENRNTYYPKWWLETHLVVLKLIHFQNGKFRVMYLQASRDDMIYEVILRLESALGLSNISLYLLDIQHDLWEDKRINKKDLVRRCYSLELDPQTKIRKSDAHKYIVEIYSEQSLASEDTNMNDESVKYIVQSVEYQIQSENANKLNSKIEEAKRLSESSQNAKMTNTEESEADDPSTQNPISTQDLENQLDTQMTLED